MEKFTPIENMVTLYRTKKKGINLQASENFSVTLSPYEQKYVKIFGRLPKYEI